MSSNYRVLVHYQFKEGMEEQAIRFLEKELIAKGREYGCHYIELWQNERDPTILEGVAAWNDLQDAQRFQAQWEKKEEQFIHQFCAERPTREFCKLRSIYMEKAKKAA